MGWGVVPDPNSLLSKILKSFRDTDSTLRRVMPEKVSWIPPPTDWLKLSMDADVGEIFSCAVVVVRDPSGLLVFWKSKRVSSTNPMHIEAMTMSLAIFGFVWFLLLLV